MSLRVYLRSAVPRVLRASKPQVGKDGLLYVKSMLPAGAAHRSSLVQVGDCLRKIDGKKVLGKPVDKVSLSLSLSLSL